MYILCFFKKASGIASLMLSIILIIYSIPVFVNSAGASLKVQMYSNSNKESTNTIQLRIRLVNTSAASINLNTVKVRYYYTVNGYINQSFNCYSYNGGSTSYVTGTFKPLNTVSSEADCYLEVGFTGSVGSLPSGQSRDLYVAINKNNWENYTQTDDYSFNPGSTYIDWNKTTAYINGSLVWGTEPALTTALPDQSIKLQMYNISNNSKFVSFKINMINIGAGTINLKDVIINYYYTIDGDSPQSYSCYWYENGNTSDVKITFTKVQPPLSTVDYIAHINFTNAGDKLLRGEQRELYCAINKNNWSDFNNANDYSSSNSDDYVDWDKITCSIGDELCWGIDPSNPSPTNTPTSTPAPTSTATPTNTAKPTNTATPTLSPTPTSTPVVVNAMLHKAMTNSNRFAVGDNIPASLQMKINRTISSPVLNIDMNFKKDSAEQNSGFKIKTLGKNFIDKQYFKAYKNGVLINSNNIIIEILSSGNSDNQKLQITINSSFAPNDIIKINYRVKLTASNSVYKYGLSRYIKDKGYNTDEIYTDFELIQWIENGNTVRNPYNKNTCTLSEKNNFIMGIKAEDNLILF
ncbi:MAG TPA: cellulose binding domain-containing protein [Pseudobacteroides sp.]|uniref:cellulose binding domain-containing protein n=1 Tax=Pseudobacteroides sp. TaxID=1968840 RepID=UPI002F94EB0D